MLSTVKALKVKAGAGSTDLLPLFLQALRVLQSPPGKSIVPKGTEIKTCLDYCCCCMELLWDEITLLKRWSLLKYLSLTWLPFLLHMLAKQKEQQNLRWAVWTLTVAQDSLLCPQKPERNCGATPRRSSASDEKWLFRHAHHFYENLLSKSKELELPNCVMRSTKNPRIPLT